MAWNSLLSPGSERLVARPASPRAEDGVISRSALLAIVVAIGLVAYLGVRPHQPWILWLTVHLIELVGFRNRLVVLFEWAWAYLTYQRGARVIIECPHDWGGGHNPSAGERSKP